MADVATDSNFTTLASQKTKADDFVRLLSEHVFGYTQKKRVQDGLKSLLEKVEAVEQKAYLAKTVGKAKGKLDFDEQQLTETYESFDIKDKMKTLRSEIDAMLEQGPLTQREIPVVRADLHARAVAAKDAGKAKLQEKLELQLISTSKLDPANLPMSNLLELHVMNQTIKQIQVLEKRPLKSLTDEEKTQVKSQSKVEKDFADLASRSGMWFESEEEFKPRLEHMLVEKAKELAAQMKVEAEKEAERKRVAAEEELEKKRLAAVEKAEKDGLELIKKLEAAKEADKLKPVKDVPKKVVKDKKKAKLINPHSLFLTDAEIRERDGPDPSELDDEESQSCISASQTGTPAPSRGGTPMPSPFVKAAQAPAEEKVSSAKVEAAEKKRKEEDALAEAKVWEALEKKKKEEEEAAKKKPTFVAAAPIESKWGAPPSPAGGPALPSGESDELGPSLAEAAKVASVLDGPSLSDGVKKAPVNKAPVPQPKKKEKKKFAKVGVGELGFVC